MQLREVSKAALQVLNDACDGLFDSVKDHCEAHGHEAHLSVQTHIEGLPHGEMKLHIQIVGADDTVDFATARMEGYAKIVGWDIYLTDTLASGKAHLNRANAKMAQAGAEKTLSTFEQLKQTLH